MYVYENIPLKQLNLLKDDSVTDSKCIEYSRTKRICIFIKFIKSLSTYLDRTKK